MLQKLKNVWRSKTMWFNVVVLGLLNFSDMLMASLPQLQAFLPDDDYKTVGLVLTVGNIVLRFITSKPLEAKGTPKHAGEASDDAAS